MAKFSSFAVGPKLRRWREHHGLQQSQVAMRLDIGVPHVSAIENGDRTPGLKTIIHAAQMMGVSIDWLLSVEEDVAASVEEDVAAEGGPDET